MQKSTDVAVVGGGPAGLALALEAAGRGLSVVVFERGELPADKACGEGLMPPGVAALERWGARALLPDESCAPFVGIRYVREDGVSAEASLPSPGLAVRRTALSAALLQRAREAGVEVRTGTRVTLVERGEAEARVWFEQRGAVLAGGALTRDVPLRAGIVVAADGLHSPLRRAFGLERPARGPIRFGMRRHFSMRPWSPYVEVHLGDGVEGYVTPIGSGQVGVALLFEKRDGGDDGERSFEAWLSRCPSLAPLLARAVPCTAVRGAGPFRQASVTPIAERLVLLGDAAGYVDALTGEGLSLSFEMAGVLGALLPEALARGGTVDALRPYARAQRTAFRRYAQTAGALLWLARQPRLRHLVVGTMARRSDLFRLALAWATPSQGRPCSSDET